MTVNRLPVYLFQTTISFCLKTTYSTVSSNKFPQFEPDDTPRRAVLYCPGDDIKKVNKGISSEADCVVLDCEDGVAINRKREARETIRQVLDGGTSVAASRPEVAVRVNSVDSGLCEDDLATILKAAHPPHTLFLPKVDSRDHLEWFAKQVEDKLSGNRTVKLIMYAESAKAILDLPEICRAAIELSHTHRFTPVGIVLGSDDLCANIGAARSVDGAEIMYARQRLVLVAKAFGLQAIDMVHIQYKDLESLRVQSELGARMGFTGKQVIHPGQIATVQRAFSPSAEQLDWARGVVEGFQLSQQEGKGAFVHNGSMIDMPLLRQAENIIKISKINKES